MATCRKYISRFIECLAACCRLHNVFIMFNFLLSGAQLCNCHELSVPMHLCLCILYAQTSILHTLLFFSISQSASVLVVPSCAVTHLFLFFLCTFTSRKLSAYIAFFGFRDHRTSTLWSCSLMCQKTSP